MIQTVWKRVVPPSSTVEPIEMSRNNDPEGYAFAEKGESYRSLVVRLYATQNCGEMLGASV